MSSIHKTATHYSFSFNDWLDQCNLTEYRSFFEEADMTDLSTLRFDHAGFAALIYKLSNAAAVADRRVERDPQAIRRIIESIQSLHVAVAAAGSSSIHPLHSCTETTPSPAPLADTSSQDKTSDVHITIEHVSECIQRQHAEVHRLHSMLSEKQQQNQQYFSPENKLKISHYIRELDIVKSSISDSFQSLKSAIQQQERALITEIDQQQLNANTMSDAIQNKQALCMQSQSQLCPIRQRIQCNQELLEQHTHFLHEMVLQLDSLRDIERKYECIEREFERNMSAMNEHFNDCCGNCKLVLPQINTALLQQIQSDLSRVLQFQSVHSHSQHAVHPSCVNIISADFISVNLVRVQFTCTPPAAQCQVWYRVFDADDDNAGDDGEEMRWQMAQQNDVQYVKPDELIVRINNHKELINGVGVGLGDGDVMLNIKMRIKHTNSGDENVNDNDDDDDDDEDAWSAYSNLYRIANEVMTASCSQPRIQHIFYLSQDSKINRHGLYIANKMTNTAVPCSVFDLTPPHHVINATHQREKWLIKYSGICYGRNVVLPQTVAEMVCSAFGEDAPNKVNCIFKCGGTIGDTLATNYCSAIIVNEFATNSLHFCGGLHHQHHHQHARRSTAKAKSDLFALNWELPRLPQQTDCNDITYSTQYGLLLTGGWEFRYDSNKFYRLPFDSVDYFAQQQNLNECKCDDDVDLELQSMESLQSQQSQLSQAQAGWQWQIMPSMLYKRSWPTMKMLEQERKLFVVGGKGPMSECEIFDFDQNQWTEIGAMHHARSSSGMCFDACKSRRIYVGGGHGLNASNTVECYDWHKQAWLDVLPATNKPHGSRPVMWLSDNANLLYIASIFSDSMEYIDLRMDNHRKRWNLVYGQSYNHPWHRVFNTAFCKDRNGRLVLS